MTDLSVMTDPDTVRSRRSRGVFGRRRDIDPLGVGGLEIGRRRSRLQVLLDPASVVPTYIGIAVTLIGFALIATLAVIVVVIVYMLICAGCIWHYWIKRRTEFNPILHLVLPVGGIVLFFFPLYYQYVKFVPTYPIKYANWIAIGWVVAGVVLTVWLSLTRPERLRDMERVYVEDETVAATPAAAPEPA